MPFEWARYLTLAEELAGRTQEEACLRSAISRAYYAAFGTAGARLRAEGMLMRGLDSHQGIWQAYERDPHRQRREIGRVGTRLKRLRIEADYEATVTGLAPKARRTIDEARRALRLLAALEG